MKARMHPLRSIVWRCAIISTAAALSAHSAHAAEPEASDTKLPLWEVGVGAGAVVAPAYLGSNVTRSYVAPWPYLIYRGDKLHANREGIGLGVLNTDKLRLDLSLSGALPVYSRDTAREGMRDLPVVGEFGPVLKYKLIDEPGHRWSLHFPLRYATGLRRSGLEQVGWIADPTFRIIESITLMGQRFDWGLDASVKFQDKHFNDYYYRVLPSEATSQRPAYDSRGGYSGSTVNTGLLARWDHVVVGGFVGVSNIAGARFDDSPLVQKKTNVFGGLAVFWIIDKSTETATYVASLR